MTKRHSTSSLKASIIAFHLLLIAFLALLFLFVHPNEFRLQSLVTGDCEPQHRSAHLLIDAVNPRPALRVLIGILTTPETYERRHLLRTVYALQQLNLTVDARIDVFFVFCNLTKEEQRVLISLEILRYDDVVILNCSENLNGGKTYGYFSSVPAIFGGEDEEDKPYDYVMKADDDTYLRLGALAATMAAAPREDLYLRLYVPCGNLSDPDGSMTGMAYALSWDVVEWIVESEIPRRNKVHHPLGEDVVLAHWLRDGKRGRNRIDMASRTYIFEKHPPCYSQTLVPDGPDPDTVAVHGLKEHASWAKTLAYFNVTQGLEPSAFYHID